MTMVAVLLVSLMPLLPWLSIYAIVRHGPFPNRWWKGENALGFGLFVGIVAFALGFFGPMVLAPGANQGPMLGIFITGPAGLALGLVWGMIRAMRRRIAA